MTTRNHYFQAKYDDECILMLTKQVTDSPPKGYLEGFYRSGASTYMLEMDDS